MKKKNPPFYWQIIICIFTVFDYSVIYICENNKMYTCTLIYIENQWQFHTLYS